MPGQRKVNIGSLIDLIRRELIVQVALALLDRRGVQAGEEGNDRTSAVAKGVTRTADASLLWRSASRFRSSSRIACSRRLSAKSF